MSWEVRASLLSREFMMIDADVLCLQEVQNIHYDSFYKPFLQECKFFFSIFLRTVNGWEISLLSLKYSCSGYTASSLVFIGRRSFECGFLIRFCKHLLGALCGEITVCGRLPVAFLFLILKLHFFFFFPLLQAHVFLCVKSNYQAFSVFVRTKKKKLFGFVVELGGFFGRCSFAV